MPASQSAAGSPRLCLAMTVGGTEQNQPPSITASKLKNQSLLIASTAKQTKNHSHVIASIAKQTKNHSHVIASIAKQTSVLCSMPNQPISRWIATAAPCDDGGWDRTREKPAPPTSLRA